jgi:flagellar biosynthesis protein FliR
MTLLVVAARGFAALFVLTTLAGGVPRVVRLALAITLGLWSGVLVLPHVSEVAPAGTALWAPLLVELALGAALGVIAAVPLLAAAAAGRMVDLAAAGRAHGPYAALFGVLAAAVFVGIDGHVTVLTALVESHRATPALTAARPGVLAALGQLVPAAIQFAVPWLVTAAVVQIAVGAGTRIAGRSGAHAPAAAAAPAALVMMTASLIATLAIALAALMRNAT